MKLMSSASESHSKYIISVRPKCEPSGLAAEFVLEALAYFLNPQQQERLQELHQLTLENQLRLQMQQNERPKFMPLPPSSVVPQQQQQQQPVVASQTVTAVQTEPQSSVPTAVEVPTGELPTVVLDVATGRQYRNGEWKAMTQNINIDWSPNVVLLETDEQMARARDPWGGHYPKKKRTEEEFKHAKQQQERELTRVWKATADMPPPPAKIQPRKPSEKAKRKRTESDGQPLAAADMPPPPPPAKRQPMKPSEKAYAAVAEQKRKREESVRIRNRTRQSLSDMPHTWAELPHVPSRRSSNAMGGIGPIN